MAMERAKPNEVISLRPLGGDLAKHKTTALVKTDRFETIRLVVPAGVEIPAHQVAGFITLHCLEGRVSLGPSGIALDAGDWVYLERGAPHSVKAHKDASLLLTILFDAP